MSTPHRFTTNRAPSQGHLPADWATTSHPWRGQFWRMSGVALLIGAGIYAAGLALRAMGGG